MSSHSDTGASLRKQRCICIHPSIHAKHQSRIFPPSLFLLLLWESHGVPRPDGIYTVIPATSSGTTPGRHTRKISSERCPEGSDLTRCPNHLKWLLLLRLYSEFFIQLLKLSPDSLCRKLINVICQQKYFLSWPSSLLLYLHNISHRCKQDSYCHPQSWQAATSHQLSQDALHTNQVHSAFWAKTKAFHHMTVSALPFDVFSD